MRLDILAFGAHPDDVELGAAGTLAKEIAAGKTVGIVDLTGGELGTRGSESIRNQEAGHAANILGVTMRHNMRFEDGFFKNDREHQMALIKVIRAYQPKLVICNAIRDRHIDHGKGSQLVSDACFLSGLSKIETKDDSGQTQEAWRPDRVYHYIQWHHIQPDIVVDISGFMDVKMAAVGAYKSQFYDPKNKAPNTAISSPNFLNSVQYRAADLGRIIGTDFGEGFTVERFPAVESLFDLI
jgi:N-acetylglucosamine malate deacetylase 1